MGVVENDEQVAAASVVPGSSAEAIADPVERGGGRHGEAQTLRARSTKLEELMEAARADLIVAKERREFMQEEAEQGWATIFASNVNRLLRHLRMREGEFMQGLCDSRRHLEDEVEMNLGAAREVVEARDYGEKLAHEMERLQRLQQALYPDQRASLEILRRLVARLAELEAQEQAAREESLRREDQLRQEIADFKGSSAAPGARLDSGKNAGKAARESTRGVRPVMENPLTEDEQGDVAEDTPGVERLQTQEDKTGAAGTQDRVLEGNALLSEGLMRIEAAHRAAAAERDVVATRLSRLRLVVASRQREEDATPGHAELLQYLSRFEELGLHARERDTQLRRCQAEKSMLALTRETLAEEARLLETVAGGVDEASKLKNVREAFLKQFDGMIEGVEDSLTNQNRLLEDIRGRRHAAGETQETVSKERKQFLAGTKEFNEACFRYEGLVAKLSLMRRPVG